MALYFSADHHFGHARIGGYAGRPHPTVDAMHADLVDRWNDTVTPADDVWVLGDFALGRLNESLPIVGRLHGHKFLLPGNHDRCWPGHRNAAGQTRRYLTAGFDAILETTVTRRVAGRIVRFCHFPYLDGGSTETEPYDQRYAAYRPADTGGWLVHGHVHQHWRTRGRQINVGVDAWAGRPVPFATIEAYVTADQPTHETPLPWETGSPS